VADFGGQGRAILNTERILADFSGPHSPTCKTSTAGEAALGFVESLDRLRACDTRAVYLCR